MGKIQESEEIFSIIFNNYIVHFHSINRKYFKSNIINLKKESLNLNIFSTGNMSIENSQSNKG